MESEHNTDSEESNNENGTVSVPETELQLQETASSDLQRSPELCIWITNILELHLDYCEDQPAAIEDWPCFTTRSSSRRSTSHCSGFKRIRNRSTPRS